MFQIMCTRAIDAQVVLADEVLSRHELKHVNQQVEVVGIVRKGSELCQVSNQDGVLYNSVNCC